MSQQEDHLTALLIKDVDSYFKQFVETYQHQLYRLMYRQVGSMQDTEDILQETFVRAYYALRDYAAQGVSLQYIRPWLYKIAFNVYYNRLRATRPLVLPLDMLEEGMLFELEYPGPGPEELVDRQESLREVSEAIASLPEHYRVVLGLYYVEQLSYQEVADLLHQPLGTIKSKIHRGLNLVRAVLNNVRREERAQ
ncbi:MAG TPA: sigma-70 family RNA polymerase sigma factor [Ktedonobacteraceae bacterium]|jgi:RNA polymerase sigma-70 factor (ECF subfamily)|nr:sigma-70 family RNA polymerase sigma factor [Ktedonobacteraceae bacterium]